MTNRFSANEILLRWFLAWICFSIPTVALMYLPAIWAVGLSLIAGYGLAMVFQRFGFPFQGERNQ